MKINYTIASAYIMFFILPLITTAQSEKNPLENKLLIITHMQDSYQKGELSQEATHDEIELINQLIKSTKSDYVVYSKAMHKILNLTLKKIYVEESVKDLDDRLNVISDNIIVDHGGDIFNSNELTNFIKQKNVKELVIVGRVAEECINTSVKSGLKLGYVIHLIPDAIVAKSEKSKERVLSKLEKKGANILILD